MEDWRFQLGFADACAGHPPRFDDAKVGNTWEYERGRQFAVAAPGLKRLLLSNGMLDPKAIAAYRRHLDEEGL